MYGKGTAGRVGLLKFKATTNQACCARICHDENKALYLYLYLLIKQSKIENLANGSVQQNLSKDVIGNLNIPVPPTDVLENVNFKTIFNKIENNFRENKKLTKIRYILLPKLMYGELDVSNVQI